MDEKPSTSRKKSHGTNPWIIGAAVAIWITAIGFAFYSGESAADITKWAIGMTLVMALLHFAGRFIDALLGDRD